MKENRLQIKIITKEIPKVESDRALFSLFDFILADKSKPDIEKKVDKDQLPISTSIHG